jgi:hypothetical protein
MAVIVIIKNIKNSMETHKTFHGDTPGRVQPKGLQGTRQYCC